MKPLLVVIVSSLVTSNASAADVSGVAAPPPTVAASLSGASDGAAAARDQVINDAVADLKAAQARGDTDRYLRPWQDARWLTLGSPKVGRLYDLCTGAVEPPPTLAGGPWRWGSLDPRTLSPDDRRKLVDWQAQQVTAQFSCGTTFTIGSLSADAHRQLKSCPAGHDDVTAFIAHVHRRPALRDSDDLTAVLVEALRATGCN